MPVRTPTQTVVAAVKAEMARRSHSQISFAPLVGMRQQALSRRLSGKTPFTIDELARIASALEVPLSHLVSDVAA
jgi:transcriptional regulator with XRE-family HTH domain